MSAFTSSNTAPITGRDDLIAHIASGSKPREQWAIGTEHEIFAYRRDTLNPPTYAEAGGIRDVLNALTRFGWEPVLEAGNIIALSRNGASVSLEPAGQLELSGAPLTSLHQTCAEVASYRRDLIEVTDSFGLGLLGLGFQPTKTRAEMPWMPKGRYAIMREYMPKRGTLGLDMMLRTCTVQVNLDYASEPDMVKKMRVSAALQPIATALFANSPLTEGKPNGYLSYRMHIWSDTDPDRSGMPDFVFDQGFGFESWVDYALDVPMYFVYREGRYIDASGQSFRDFMAGKLPAYPGHKPTLGDWADHLSTAFPDVRLKKYIELRGADSGPWGRLCALPALWTGLLYDDVALDAAWELCKHWTPADRAQLRADVPRLALKATVAGRSVADVAADVVGIARQGLVRRNFLNASGDNESGFLGPLEDIARKRRTAAEEILEMFHGEWGGNAEEIYKRSGY